MSNKIKIVVILIFLLALGFFLISNSKKQAVSNFTSEQQVIDTVKSLPEVNKYLKEGNKNAPPFIKAEERKDNYWYIQIGSITPATKDTLAHTATFNWYKVDSQTGKIVCSLFLYDKNGKFLGSGETKSICIQDQNQNPLSQAIEAINKEGYDVYDTKIFNPNSDFNVLIGSKLGSADGYIQKAFFFNKDKYLGTDTKTPSITIFYAWRKDDIIALKYILYNKDDALCCSTAGNSIVRFKWDGINFKPLDKIPTDDINSDKHR